MKIAPSTPKHPSLQSRIASFYFFSFFAVFIVSAPALYFYWMSVYNSEVNKLFVSRAQLVGHIWIEESLKGPSGLKKRMDKDLETGGMSVGIYDSGGRILYSRGMEAPLRLMSRGFMAKTRESGFTIISGSERGRYRKVAVPVYHRGGLEGFVVAEFSMEVARHLRRTFLGLVPVIAALLFAVAFLLSRTLGAEMLSSIETVTDATHRISAEHLDERIEAAELDVEFLPLAENFNRMCDRLGASFATLRRFTSDASHELRTPLSIVRSRLEIALQRERAGEEYVETISESLDAVNRLTRIVNTLLMMARSESGDAAFKKTDIDLSAVVREVADFISPIAEDKGLTLNLSLYMPAPMKGDEEWLRHAVFNLLDNSIKFCRPADTITVALNHCNGGNVLKVSDTGPGIAPEHLPFIFDRFYRGQNPSGETGTGLGLALCRWVVTGHKGEITASSKPGGGATFVVTLPVG